MTGGAGGFNVDPATVQQLIKDLTAELGQLQRVRESATDLARTQPPGKDPVSAAAVQAMNRRATDDEGCYGQAAQNLMTQVQDAINALTKSLQNYQHTDASAAQQVNRHQA